MVNVQKKNKKAAMRTVGFLSYAAYFVLFLMLKS